MVNLTRRQIQCKYWLGNKIANCSRGEIYKHKLIAYISTLEKKLFSNEYKAQAGAYRVLTTRVEEARLLLSMTNCKKGGKFLRGNSMIVVIGRYCLTQHSSSYFDPDFDGLTQFHIERTHTGGEAYSLLLEVESISTFWD